MDSEQLKLKDDDVELNKLMNLSRLLYMIRSLVINSDAHKDMYEDVKKLISFVTLEVEPKLRIPTCNVIEFNKRCVYMMLKYAGEDFIRAADAKRRGKYRSDEILTVDNQLDELKSVHDRLKEVAFDSSYSMWTDGELMTEITKDYCKIMSQLVYNRHRDSMDDKTMNELKYQPCYFCHRDASVSGVGRIEGMCEEDEQGGLVSETFTNFANLRYKSICCHYIGDVEKYKTSWDKLLSRQSNKESLFL